MQKLHDEPRIELACGLIFVTTILLQKFSIPRGDFIAVPYYAIFSVLLWAQLRGILMIDALRLLLFSFLICAMLLSLVIGQALHSAASIGQMLLIYSLLLFRINIDRNTLLRSLVIFQKAMCWIALVVVLQQVVQHVASYSDWPNLNALPGAVLVPGFTYFRPVGLNSPYMMPNGIFFLEPSGVSLFFGLALVSELVWFRNLPRAAILGIGLIACVAATGVIVLGLLSPWLLLRLDRRAAKWAVGLAVPVLITALLLGTFRSLSDRSEELSATNTSAYLRIVRPFNQVVDLSGDPQYLLSGNGPGTSPKLANVVQWPASKFLYEYGMLSAVAFHVFLLTAVLRGSPSRLVGSAILIPHLLFGGGIVASPNIMALLMFGSLLRIRPDPVARDVLLPHLAQAA